MLCLGWTVGGRADRRLPSADPTVLVSLGLWEPAATPGREASGQRAPQTSKVAADPAPGQTCA